MTPSCPPVADEGLLLGLKLSVTVPASATTVSANYLGPASRLAQGVGGGAGPGCEPSRILSLSRYAFTQQYGSSAKGSPLTA